MRSSVVNINETKVISVFLSPSPFSFYASLPGSRSLPLSLSPFYSKQRRGARVNSLVITRFCFNGVREAESRLKDDDDADSSANFQRAFFISFRADAPVGLFIEVSLDYGYVSIALARTRKFFCSLNFSRRGVMRGSCNYRPEGKHI